MSYNNESIKQICGPSMEDLVSAITGIDKSAPGFKRKVDFCWRQLFSQYHTSIDDQDTKQKLLSYSEKFIFHGFPQKANNLRTLVAAYENSEYFKNSSPAERWGIIDLLLSLSYRPTDASEDDPPINLDQLCIDEGAQNEDTDQINWPQFLKEGMEKFKLPSDEESICESDVSDVNLPEINPPEIEAIPNIIKPIPRIQPLADTHQEQQLELLRKKQALSDWLTKHKQPQWWKIPGYREEPRRSLLTGHIRTEETFCITSERKLLELGYINQRLTILSEYKVLRTLIWALGAPPEKDTYLISSNEKGFYIKDNISIPSLDPLMFKKIVQQFFLDDLYYVREVNNFIKKLAVISPINPETPNTLNMYARSLTRLMAEYTRQLFEIENEVKKQETYYSLRRLYMSLKTKNWHWLRLFKFIAYLNKRAVSTNFTRVENWKCSLRLLSVIYDHLKTCVNWQRIVLLRLFVESLESYMDIAGSMMAGNFRSDLKKEFILFRSENENEGIGIKDYQLFLSSLKSDALQFWEPFVSTCFRAISSVHLLNQLGKHSDYHRANHNNDILHSAFCQKLRAALNQIKPMKEIADNLTDTEWMTLFPEENLNSMPNSEGTTSFGHNKMFGDEFDNRFRKPVKRVFEKTSSIKFGEDVTNAHCDNFELPDLEIILEKMAIQTIEDYMEPIGFAVPNLLVDYKLLDLFNCLRSVFFLHAIQPFMKTLYTMMSNKRQWSYNWTEKLRICLAEHYPSKTVDKFSICLGKQTLISELIASNNVVGLLSFVNLNYQADEELRLIITNNMLRDYNLIFRFLSQLKYAHGLILSLRLNDLQETNTNYIAVRSLYSLRIWLLHTMNALNNYFFYVNEKSFNNKIITACLTARDFHSIQNAHKEFIISYKKQCFLMEYEHRTLVETIFQLCQQLSAMWALQANNKDINDSISKFETGYLNAVKSLISMLQSVKHKMDANFALLYDDIINNLAVENIV